MERQEDDISRMPMWKSYLYHLQQQAPQPKRIVCQREVATRPAYYGREYHGAISREDADFLLTIGGQGAYLIRESLRAPGQFTLAIRFEGITKNFKLYYDGQHYVGEKRFDTVQDLVADGLITFYLESKAADYIASLSSQSNYAESPYVAYNTHKKKQLAAPRRDRHKTRERGGGGGAGEPSTSQQQPQPSSSSSSNQPANDGSSSPVLRPGPALQRKGGATAAAANIPVETRLSQIIENRQDANRNIHIQDPKRSPQLSSKVSPGGGGGGSSSGSPQLPQQGRRRDPPVPPTVPISAPPPPSSREDPGREYQNTTINREMVRQSILSQGGMPVEMGGSAQGSADSTPPAPAAAAAGTSSDHSDGSAERERISSSTNTDGPTRTTSSSYERSNGSKNSSHDRTSNQNSSSSSNERIHHPHKNSPQQERMNISHDRISIGSQNSSHERSGSQKLRDRANNRSSPSHERRSSRNSPHNSRNSSSSCQSSRNSSMDGSSKNHNFKMFDDPHFSTPPSSPPLPGSHAPHHPSVAGLAHLEALGGPGNPKLGSVSWCTDYLEVMGSEKPHNFKQHTFKGPHWCDFCANFLWGLIAQGVKCQDCGFNAHKRCSEKVPNDCMPDMKYVKRMFGIDLTTLVKAQNTLIPAVVEKCIQEIESRGLEHEGLYRVAGFHDDVEAIKMSFDKDGDMTDISETAYDDINTITSVLKLYFRLLPIPLVTFDIYFQVIDIVKVDQNQDQMFDMLRNCLAVLPPSHYHTTKYLMSHLHRVTEAKHKNMMSPENLAIVFAPTLLRSPETDPLSGLTAVKYERELIELLIMHHNVLFD